MVDSPLISKDALIQAMVAALNHRSVDSREGITESEIRELVEIIYGRSLDTDSTKMNKEIEKFLDKATGGE